MVFSITGECSDRSTPLLGCRKVNWVCLDAAIAAQTGLFPVCWACVAGLSKSTRALCLGGWAATIIILRFCCEDQNDSRRDCGFLTRCRAALLRLALMLPALFMSRPFLVGLIMVRNLTPVFLGSLTC